MDYLTKKDKTLLVFALRYALPKRTYALFLVSERLLENIDQFETWEIDTMISDCEFRHNLLSVTEKVDEDNRLNEINGLKISLENELKHREEVVINMKNANKIRGFEVVAGKYREYPEEKIILPVRKTKYSAGYDFPTPIDIIIQPHDKVLVFSDIKAYMLDDEVLKLYIRSSLGVKKGLVLSNGTGIIDKDYHNNLKNDGNIGLALKNTTNKIIHIKKGECIAQGIFVKYLVSDDDYKTEKENRNGGIGSTNHN